MLATTNATAAISMSVNSAAHRAHIHVVNETLASVMTYLRKHYGTTSVFPAAIAKDRLDADIHGASLMGLTQRLLRAYNIGLIADDVNRITHISILSAGKSERMVEVGQVSPANARMQRRLWHGRNINSSMYGRRSVVRGYNGPGRGRFGGSRAYSASRSGAPAAMQQQRPHRWH